MKILAGGLTDVGVTRSHNEDSVFWDTEKGLFVVADGVGGLSAGEVASKMAVEVLNDYVGRAMSNNEPFLGKVDEGLTDEANRLVSGIRLANQVIYESSRSNVALRGMGSTVVAVMLKDGNMSIAHVGDSRAYLIRDNTIMQVTDDHSLVSEQVKGGLLSREDAQKSEMKNVITRALGVGPEVEVDVEDIGVSDGDIIVLCSDGLSNMVPDDMILYMATSEDDPQRACERLVAEANEKGGKDNISVIVARVRKAGLLSYFRKLYK